MTDREVMQMALEALIHHTGQTRPIFETDKAIAALVKALAAPEKEAPFTPDWVNYRQGFFDGREAEREALAAPQRQPLTGWQPMETAPKDGTEILLITSKGRIASGMWVTVNSEKGYWVWPYVTVEPNGWMQLPSFCQSPLPAHEIVTMYDESPTCDADMIEFARAIEQAHGITKGPAA